MAAATCRGCGGARGIETNRNAGRAEVRRSDRPDVRGATEWPGQDSRRTGKDVAETFWNQRAAKAERAESQGKKGWQEFRESARGVDENAGQAEGKSAGSEDGAQTCGKTSKADRQEEEKIVATAGRWRGSWGLLPVARYSSVCWPSIGPLQDGVERRTKGLAP